MSFQALIEPYTMSFHSFSPAPKESYNSALKLMLCGQEANGHMLEAYAKTGKVFNSIMEAKKL